MAKRIKARRSALGTAIKIVLLSTVGGLALSVLALSGAVRITLPTARPRTAEPTWTSTATLTSTVTAGPSDTAGPPTASPPPTRTSPPGNSAEATRVQMLIGRYGIIRNLTLVNSLRAYPSADKEYFYVYLEGIVTLGANRTLVANALRTETIGALGFEPSEISLILFDGETAYEYTWVAEVQTWRITPLSAFDRAALEATATWANLPRTETPRPTARPPTRVPATRVPLALPTDPPLVPAGGGACPGMSYTCSQLTCQQAYACLAAGNTSLDRDRDGVPCETQCQ